MTDASTILEWGNDRLVVRFAINAAGVMHVAGMRADGTELTMLPGLPLVDVVTVNRGRVPASDRLVHSSVGAALRYVGHREELDDAGSPRLVLELVDRESGLTVRLVLVAPRGAAAFRAVTTVVNRHAAQTQVLRSVTSFSSALGRRAGQAGEGGGEWTLHSAMSDWLAEGRWASQPISGGRFARLGEGVTGQSGRGALRRASTGTWSTGRFLPVAVVESERDGVALGWQIEHNGGWRWEVGTCIAGPYMAASGPTDDDHQWILRLEPGEAFTSVPVTVALASDLESVIAELTRYRRRARREHADNAAMPVIFNDYMNTLNGDPTAERLAPLIDAAAEAGAEYFCIDAGWYGDGYWWDTVGDWRPGERRFPDGLNAVLDRIRGRRMVPGLWLEPEVVGVRSEMATRLPDAAFLSRRGVRVVEHERFHLDLRHEAAVMHLDAVIDRLVRDHGVGYFKLDYNVNPGPGTDRDADSAGAALLDHNRAHLAWIDGVLDRHPGLVLENCGSGAMRADFAMLSRLQLQSTSDQQDPLLYPPVAAAAPGSMLPEQAANWAYPQPTMAPEAIAFTLVTALLGRFYLSGHLDRMTPGQLGLVQEAVREAKRLRSFIRSATPFWPLGLPAWDAPQVALGLGDARSRLVSVWDRGGSRDEIHLPLEQLRGRPVDVSVVFPRSLPAWRAEWDTARGVLDLCKSSKAPEARVFRLSAADGVFKAH